MSKTYDRERPTFEDSNNVTIKRCLYAYEFSIPYIRDKVVTDIGCGNGYGSVFMSKYAKQVTGLDYSEKTVAENQENYKENKNLFFKPCNVPPICMESESTDVVTAFQFIEHIHERREFMKDVWRVLKPGGVFICTTPNIKMSIARNPFHVHEYTFEEFRNEVSGIFDEYLISGLSGNERVNTYYAANALWAKRILRFDPLGIHKLLPAVWLVRPYNYLTSMMRNSLKHTQKQTLDISTNDFFLQEKELDSCWDIYLVAKKIV